MKDVKRLVILTSLCFFAMQNITEANDMPIINVKVTAASEDPWGEGRLAENLVNGSGFNEDDLSHNQHYLSMWLSDGGGAENPNPGTTKGATWLRFEFDNVYTLNMMRVWNYNQKDITSRGLKNVTIEYSSSTNPENIQWKKLGDFKWPKADGTGADKGFQAADFGGIKAKYVVVTAEKTDGNWGGLGDTQKAYGLSEVRFYGTTAFATNPDPVNSQIKVTPDTILSWIPGQDAATHDIYISTDESAVANATRKSHKKVQHYSKAQKTVQYKPSKQLEFNTTYYWRIDEVGKSGKPEINSNIWRFKVGTAYASENVPKNGKKGIGRLLKWTRGSNAADVDSQDVYLGTDYEEVTNADTSLPQYMGRQSQTSYDTTGFNNGKGLEFGKTYYWRVDQINAKKQWKGDTWSFTCARNLIFNCDGYGVFINAEQESNSAQQVLGTWIRNMFEPLEGTGVDSFFWCDGGGGNNARYGSDVLELWGERVDMVPPILKELIDAGNDPPKIVVREAHKRGYEVFFSFRFNDTHDYLKDDPKNPWAAQEFATFKEENPDWLIGHGHPYGFWSTLDFAKQGVRDIKFETVKEIFQKYDFDGIEIDFKRSCPYFVPGTESENAHYLTKLLRRIRKHLDQRGEERGRKIELAVRVDENLDACILDGFDVEAWIAEDLVDIIIAGAGTGDIEIEDFKSLIADKNIKVYACLEKDYCSYYRPRPAELVRAQAANYYYQKADGIYTFNWFPHSYSAQTPLLRQISDTDNMKGTNMMFVAEHNRNLLQEIIDSGFNDVSPQQYNWLRGLLPAKLESGKVLKLPILVGKDLKAENQSAKIELQIHLDRITKHDRINILINRKILKNREVTNNVITIPLTPDHIKLGTNEILINALSGSFTVDAAEIHVKY